MGVSGTTDTETHIYALLKRIQQLEESNAQLKKKAQYFDEHLTHLPNVYYRYNIQNNEYDYISPKIKDLTGYTVDEFKKKTITSANEEIHPDDIEQVLDEVKKLFKTRAQRASAILVYRRKIKTGNYLWVENNLTLIKNADFNPICFLGYARDITKLKMTEEVQRNEKKLNQFILDSNPNLIYVKNSEGRYLMANKTLANYFEIEHEQLIKRLNSDFFTLNNNINFYDKSERQVVQEGVPVTYEEKFTTPSGKHFYFQTTKTPLKMPGEEPLILVNSTNITDKLKADNNLKKSEALYKNLINSLNFPFIMLDNQGNIKVLNKSAIQWLHLKNKKWEGIHWKKIGELHRIAKTGGISFSEIKKTSDFEIKTLKSNKPTWLWCNVQPVYDHQSISIGQQIIIFDITLRKTTTEKLRQNEVTFRGIINASSDLIFLINHKSRLITANQAAQKYCDMRLEEMMNQNAVDLFGTEKGEPRQKLADLVFKTKSIQQAEEHIRNRNMVIYMYPIFNELGDVDQIAVMVRDITTLKKAETEVLKALKKEKSLNQLRSGVISTVSHEFRTPLAVILSNLQVLQKYHKQLSTEQQNSKFGLIYSSINQLDYMLDNISLLDKNARGLLRYNPTEVILENEITQIVDELNSIVGNTERIQTKLNDTFGKILMDSMLFRHITTNLLSNALKFSDKNKPVTFSIKKMKDNWITVHIRDHGVGIKKAELENIWEPFFRGSNSDGVKGTGIGISIVKNCTDLCEGEVKIKSTYKKGTTVTVNIPYQDCC